MNKIAGLLLFGALLSSCAKPMADFVIKQDNTTVPSTISFENTSKNAEKYSWDFGDGNASLDTNGMNRYLLSGKYEITLIAEKGNKKSMSKKEIILNAPEICLIELETNHGSMLVQLYDDTPKHRDNFIKLAEEGYYEGLLFHRVIEGFMIQGGDPKSKDAKPGAVLGMGGPGYTIDAEILANRAHVKGALAAARQGDAVNPEKKSSGSQFYIVHGRPVSERDIEQFSYKNGVDYPKDVVDDYIEKGGTPFLDQSYTVFGMVVEGEDIIDTIAGLKKDSRDRPEEDVIIKKVTVIK